MNASTRSCDVLIVGAGPAGAALAIGLADAGFHVVLCDKKVFPRRKPCGEFLSPECRPYLVALGVDAALQRLGTRQIHGMRLHRGERSVSGHFVPLPAAPHSERGFAVRREVFDLCLLDAARARPGVVWLAQHGFRELLRAADGTVVGARLTDPDRAPVEVRARWVVGADGVRSAVARGLGVQRPLRWLDRLALVARYHGVPADDDAEVHFVDGGYFAATTVDDGSFHLNLVVDGAAFARRIGGTQDFLRARLAEAPALEARLRAATLLDPITGTGPLAFRTTRQVVPGAALVGDACGYVDPLTGEGIYFALHGARCLADALTLARGEPQKERAAMARYQQLRRSEVGPRLLLAALLQRGLRHRWLVEAVFGLMVRRPRLCDLVVNLTGDCLHPRDLLRPSFWRHWRRLGAGA